MSPAQIWKVKYPKNMEMTAAFREFSGGIWRKKDMEYRIATISGDGIGPEIVREAKKVLDKVGQK